jgi:hypothetical protein
MINIVLPVAATATKISPAAEEKKEHNDNQEQIHGKTSSIVRRRGASAMGAVSDPSRLAEYATQHAASQIGSKVVAVISSDHATSPNADMQRGNRNARYP